MKLRILGITAAALLASTILAAPSRAQSVSLKGNIPFAFSIGDKTLPAGEYTVGRVEWNNETVQLIRSVDGSTSALVNTTPADQSGNDNEMRLIFHRYGNRYFLSQIWYRADAGRELFKSRREKEVANGEAPTEVAILLGAPAGQ